MGAQTSNNGREGRGREEDDDGDGGDDRTRQDEGEETSLPYSLLPGTTRNTEGRRSPSLMEGGRYNEENGMTTTTTQAPKKKPSAITPTKPIHHRSSTQSPSSSPPVTPPPSTYYPAHVDSTSSTKHPPPSSSSPFRAIPPIDNTTTSPRPKRQSSKVFHPMNVVNSAVDMAGNATVNMALGAATLASKTASGIGMAVDVAVNAATSVTTNVALKTVDMASRTVHVLTTTTDAAVVKMASHTEKLAIGTASVASATFEKALNTTSSAATTAGDAVIATVTLPATLTSPRSAAGSNGGGGEVLAANNNTASSPRNASTNHASSVRNNRFHTEFETKSAVASIQLSHQQTIVDSSSSNTQLLPEATALGTTMRIPIQETSNDKKRNMMLSKFWCALGTTDLAARRQWVAHVTSQKPTLPSAKYLRKIITLAWESKGESVDEYYKFLQRRPWSKSINCAMKALVVSLRLIREGPPETLACSVTHVPVIDSIGASWASSAAWAGGDQASQDDNKEEESEGVAESPHQAASRKLHDQLLVARLSGLIVQKLHFHVLHPGCSATYELSTPPWLGRPITGIDYTLAEDFWERHVELACSLLTLLGTIESITRLLLNVGDGVLATPSSERPKPSLPSLACAVILIEEASGVFDALTATLKALDSHYELVTRPRKRTVMDDESLMKLLMHRYQTAYDEMQSYFSLASSFSYIAALKKVPVLSDQKYSFKFLASKITLETGSPLLSSSTDVPTSSSSSGGPRASILLALANEEALEGAAEAAAADANNNNNLTRQTAYSREELSNSDEVSDLELEASPKAASLKSPPSRASALSPPLVDSSVWGSYTSANGGKIVKPSVHTTNNPFDTGNSSLVLLTEAHHRGAFSFLSNPFASGMQQQPSPTTNNNTASIANPFTSSISSSNRRTPAPPSHVVPNAASNTSASVAQRALEECLRSLEFSGVALAQNQLEISNEIVGRGAFSVVYRGNMVNTGQPVAVKMLQMDKEWATSPHLVLDFRAEVAVMKAVHHPNVLHLIGACTKPHLSLVSEFCHHGNLFDTLHADRTQYPGQSPVMTWPLRLSLALGEARGMAFLHTAFPTPLIHRDLKSLNLLVSQNWTLKISDFGLSRFRGRTMGQRCGTTQWMAPEIIRSDEQDYDESVDVFSFGVNLWELMTRRIPWDRTPNVRERILAGDRVPFDVVETGAPQNLIHLAKRCMVENPRDRPTFPMIVREIQQVARGVVM